jgi:hypothetical protein
MRHNTSKLKLNRESIRLLNGEAMSRVAGGKMRLTGVSCDGDCLPPSGVPSCAPPLFTDLC